MLNKGLTRREFILYLGSLALAGCSGKFRRHPIESLPQIELDKIDGRFKPSETERSRYKVSYVKESMLEGNLHSIDYITNCSDAHNIILVHSLGEHAESLKGISNALCKYGHNVIAIDMVGHGKTKGEKGYFTVERAHQNLETAINHVDESYKGPINFIGTSIGSDFILSYLLSEDSSKDKVGGAILHAPLAPWERDLAGKLDYGISCLQSDFLKHIAKMVAGEKVSLDFLFGMDLLYNGGSDIKSIETDNNYLKEIYLKSYEDLSRYIPKNSYGILNIPMLIVAGENDRIINQNHSVKLFERIREKHEDTYFYFVEGVSHLAFDQAYDELASGFNQWIRMMV